MANNIFILDFGSGNTCKNDLAIGTEMIDRLAEVIPEDKRDNVLIKWQLFDEAGDNTPLDKTMYGKFVFHALAKYKIKSFASVFDVGSLQYLLTASISLPFVKIANNDSVRHLVSHIPRGVPVIMSFGTDDDWMLEKIVQADVTSPITRPPNNECRAGNVYPLACISKYPATLQQYEDRFTPDFLSFGISDHTDDWVLFVEYTPRVYECHFKLPDSTGLDAGVFARTPADIKDIAQLIGEGGKFEWR
jgi:sialic acid synthase SpsE